VEVSQSPRRWMPHLIWFTSVVGIVSIFLVAVFQSAPGPGECEGLGSGCDPYGEFAAVYLAIYLVPAAIVLLLAGHVLIATVSGYRHRREAAAALQSPESIAALRSRARRAARRNDRER
jgi:hypothetical protein